MKITPAIDAFINKFVRELQEENAAVFAGAGLSLAAGFVSWKELLKPIAKELGLNIDQETDLVSIAQFHLNESQTRSGLNQELMLQFSKDHQESANHRVLARLPIKTYWTTNYDKVIETALTRAGKIADVKYTVDQLQNTKPKRDAIVYKMHGDIDHPQDAVLTKDDYERYHVAREPFVTALSGDLISKTFLFLGFSFTDPNLDYILSRVRVSLHEKTRLHYCIQKRVLSTEFEDEAVFEYAQKKQALQVNDLKRFGVQTLLVDSYDDITTILQMIEDQFRQRTIFIAGAAHEYGDMTAPDAEKLIRRLAETLVVNEYKIVSGFGLGVGSHVITGVLKYVYETKGQKLHDQLMLRPFPQSEDGKKTWTDYRNDMISYAGIAIFLFGNKFENGEVVLSGGMNEEFEIAKAKGLVLIPVGATGYIAQELWKKMNANFDSYFPGAPPALREAFAALNDAKADHVKTITTIIDILKRN